jgi:hypothetical protein
MPETLAASDHVVCFQHLHGAVILGRARKVSHQPPVWSFTATVADILSAVVLTADAIPTRAIMPPPSGSDLQPGL